jgi:hypothetical protein
LWVVSDEDSLRDPDSVENAGNDRAVEAEVADKARRRAHNGFHRTWRGLEPGQYITNPARGLGGTQQSVVDPVQLAQKVEQLNRAAVTSCKSVVNTNPV